MNAEYNRYTSGKSARPNDAKTAFQIGEYVVIVKDPTAAILKGFAGKITDIFVFNRLFFYQVTAENFGPLMDSLGGGKRKVRAWVRDNVRSVPASALKRTTEVEEVKAFVDR